MRRVSAAGAVLLGWAGFLAACGGGDDDQGPRPFSAQCEAACQAPTSGPCAGAATADCVPHCLAWLEGLDDACAGCVLAASDWAGFECVCEAPNDCNVCAFGPFPPATCPGSPGFMCTAANEQCSGFLFVNTIDVRCAQVCGFGVDAGP